MDSKEKAMDQLKGFPAGRIVAWLRSPVGITILLTTLALMLATLDKGAYVLVNTVVFGGMLSLMATGLALGFNVMNIPNFAYGEFFMLGTLVAYLIHNGLATYLENHPSLFLSAIAPLCAVFGAMLAGSLMGALVEKFVFYRLRKRTREQWLMNCFLLTIGLSVIMINGHQLLFGTTFKGIVGYWDVPPYRVVGVSISPERIFAFLLAVASMFVFWFFLKFAKTGMAIRAVSQDETGAVMVGIDYNRIQTLTMALSCAMAGLAGGALLFMFPSSPSVGVAPLYYGWFVIIIVGMGNMAGTTLGGFVVALLQMLARVYIGEGLEFVIPSALMVLILIFIPSGIFGAEVRGIWDQ